MTNDIRGDEYHISRVRRDYNFWGFYGDWENDRTEQNAFEALTTETLRYYKLSENPAGISAQLSQLNQRQYVDKISEVWSPDAKKEATVQHKMAERELH